MSNSENEDSTGRCPGDNEVADPTTTAPHKKRKQTLLEQILALPDTVERSEGFHAAYGAADAGSVVYSTLVKHPCDVLSDPKDYNANLANLLKDPASLSLILFECLVIGTLSVLGNAKLKAKDAKGLAKFSVTYWPYLRDVLKGMKNSYKGVKGSLAILSALDMVSKHSIRAIAIPVGLSMGVVCAANRIWNRNMNNTRKDLTKDVSKLQDDIQELNDFLRTKQTLNQRIFELEQIKTHAAELQDEIERLTTLSEQHPENNEFCLTAIKQKQATLSYLLYKPEQRLLLNEIQEIKAQAKDVPASHPLHKKLAKLSQEFQKTTSQANDIASLNTRIDELKLLRTEKAKTQKGLDALRFAEASATLYESLTSLTDTASPNKAQQQALSTLDALAQTKAWNQKQKLAFLKQLSEHAKENAFFCRQLKDKTKTADEKAILKSQKKENTANLLLLLNEKAVVFKDFAVDYIFGSEDEKLTSITGQYQRKSTALKSYSSSHSYQLLISNAIAGFVDAPYLYVGVIGLAVLNGALLIALSSIIGAFLLASIFCRVFEEQEKQRATRITLIDNDLALKANQLIKAQNNYHALLRENADKDQGDDKESETYNELRAAFKSWNQTFDELKKEVKPSYYRALITGIKDGLSSFGALASLFYATSIILTICSVSFPPALLVAGVVAGLAAVFAFAAYHLYQEHKAKKNYQNHCNQEQDFTDSHEDTEALSYLWISTRADELQGETAFVPRISEVLRAFFSGGGKGRNLGAFAHPNDDPHSLVDNILSLILGVLYGFVLGLRALAKGFASKKNAKGKQDSTPAVHEQEKTLEGVIKEFESNQPPSPSSYNMHHLFRSSLRSSNRSATPTPPSNHLASAQQLNRSKTCQPTFFKTPIRAPKPSQAKTPYVLTSPTSP